MQKWNFPYSNVHISSKMSINSMIVMFLVDCPQLYFTPQYMRKSFVKCTASLCPAQKSQTNAETELPSFECASFPLTVNQLNDHHVSVVVFAVVVVLGVVIFGKHARRKAKHTSFYFPKVCCNIFSSD